MDILSKKSVTMGRTSRPSHKTRTASESSEQLQPLRVASNKHNATTGCDVMGRIGRTAMQGSDVAVKGSIKAGTVPQQRANLRRIDAALTQTLNQENQATKQPADERQTKPGRASKR
jgi:hypothetical protein